MLILETSELYKLYKREIGLFESNLVVNENTSDGPVFRDVRLFVQQIQRVYAERRQACQVLSDFRLLIRYCLKETALRWHNELPINECLHFVSVRRFCIDFLNRFEPEAIQAEEARQLRIEEARLAKEARLAEEKARQLEQQQAEEARRAKEKAEAFACRRCPEKYPSNTKLHEHVRTKHAKKPKEPTPPAPPASPPISMTTAVAPPTPVAIPSPPTTPKKPVSWAEIASRPKPTTPSRLPRPTITITHGLPTPPHSPILQPFKLANSITNQPTITRVKTPYLTVEDLYTMFHEKPRPASLSAIQTRLPSAHASGQHMRLHQMRITSYFMAHTTSHDITPPHTRKWKPTSRLIAGPRSPPYSTNRKSDRPSMTNSATSGPTPGFTHPPPTSATSKASHMENTLAFNR
ncbi:MAG: hypothetical protein HETSPECPRED_007637, partial [Heterodermia speciosa]